MSSSRRQQKKTEQKKKQRALQKKETRKTAIAASSPAALNRLAPSAPVVAAYISPSYLSQGDELVTAAVSRRFPGAGVVTATALVDRRCLGVKNGAMFGPDRWPVVRDRMADNPDMALSETDLLVVQSVVFHALDYAASLGFSPHRDFLEGFFGPRPAELLATPLAYPARPSFVSGPYDNVDAIVKQLTRSVGKSNFDVTTLMGPGGGFDFNPDDEDEGEEYDGDDVLDTEGEEVPLTFCFVYRSRRSRAEGYRPGGNQGSVVERMDPVLRACHLQRMVQARRLVTYADIEALPAHVTGQIIDGELHAPPRPRDRHSKASSRLGAILVNAFDDSIRGPDEPGGWVFRDEPELQLGSDTLVPDIAGWRTERATWPDDVMRIDIAPDWVCEILSPSTEAFDRSRKIPAFARHGVKHAWLVDPEAQVLEVFELSAGELRQRGPAFQGHTSVKAPPFEARFLDVWRVWE